MIGDWGMSGVDISDLSPHSWFGIFGVSNIKGVTIKDSSAAGTAPPKSAFKATIVVIWAMIIPYRNTS